MPDRFNLEIINYQTIILIVRNARQIQFKNTYLPDNRIIVWKHLGIYSFILFDWSPCSMNNDYYLPHIIQIIRILEAYGL